MILFTKPLETQRLYLKRGNQQDYEKVYEFDFRKLRNINNEFEFVKQDLSKIGGWALESDYNDDFVDWIIYLKSGIPIGNITADRAVPEINAIEISFNMHPNYWNKGYMKEACIEVMCYLFSLGFENILCGYSEGNIKSKNFNSKIGFKDYRKTENAWYNNGVGITDYKRIMSKEDFYHQYSNQLEEQEKRKR